VCGIDGLQPSTFDRSIDLCDLRIAAVGLVRNYGRLSQYTGNVAPNERLGIPPITMNDGPQGKLARVHDLLGIYSSSASWSRAAPA
jgi:hypothetical protein